MFSTCSHTLKRAKCTWPRCTAVTPPPRPAPRTSQLHDVCCLMRQQLPVSQLLKDLNHQLLHNQPVSNPGTAAVTDTSGNNELHLHAPAVQAAAVVSSFATLPFIAVSVDILFSVRCCALPQIKPLRLRLSPQAWPCKPQHTACAAPGSVLLLLLVLLTVLAIHHLYMSTSTSTEQLLSASKPIIHLHRSQQDVFASSTNSCSSSPARAQPTHVLKTA